MPLFTKIAVVVAGSALASGTVLSGAAIAHAQPADDAPFTSPSSVSVSGRGVESTVTYTNRSGQDLVCGVLVGPGRLLAKFYAEVRSSGGVGGVSEDLRAEVMLAMEKGRLGIVSFPVQNGETAVAVAEPSDPGAQSVLTDSSFAPAALAMCSNLEFDPEYAELELSPGAGVPSGLGSLDATLTGLGSSGSVAATMGSLGS